MNILCWVIQPNLTGQWPAITFFVIQLQHQKNSFSDQTNTY